MALVKIVVVPESDFERLRTELIVAYEELSQMEVDMLGGAQNSYRDAMLFLASAMRCLAKVKMEIYGPD